MRTRRSLALVVGFALLGAACGSDDDETSSSSSSTTTGGTTTTAAATTTTVADEGCTAERKGGQLTMGVGSLMARGLDPTVALGTGVAGATEIGALFDTLMRYNPDTGEVETHLAESLEANTDATEWTLTLPEGVVFGNGDPLTAEAVRFSVDRLAKGTVAASGMAQEVASMEVVDDQTIVFTTKQPWGGFPYFLAAEGGMVVNPTVVAAKGDQFANDPTGGGVGPFEFQRFEPNVEIILKAKDDYWGGPVCLDTLRFVQVQGGRGTFEAFQAGELDVMFVLEGDVLADIEAAGVQGRSAFNAAGSGYLLNSGRGTAPVLADVRLRKAISHAIDPDLLNERVYKGNGIPNTGITDPQMLIWTGLDGLEYDVEEAKRLVAEAKADGFDGNVTITCGDTPTAIEQTITTKALLDAVGFTTTVENLASAQANQKILLEGNFQMGCGSASIFAEGPFRGMNQFHSASVRNRVGYANPDMDAAISAIYQARDVEEMTAAMLLAQEAWNDDPPAVMPFSTEWFVGHTDEVHGLTMTREAAVLWHDAWIE